jgi:integrase
MKRRAKGEGSIYHRKDGRWAAALTLENGKRKFMYRHTQEEAVRALQIANQAKMQGNLTSTRNETVEMFFMDWLHFRLQPQVRERTYQGYHDLIVKHILPTLGHIKLQKLTPMQIQQLYDLKRQQQYSPQTILKIHKILRRVLEDAVYLHHIQYNVCQKVYPPRQPKGHLIAKALSVAEAKQLLAAARGDELEALYVLAITTGMRQGELLALTWDDIDFTTGKLQVRRSLNRSSQKQTGGVASELKTVSSRRCIQLTPMALDALQRHALQQKHLQEETKKRKEKREGRWVFCNTRGNPLRASSLIRSSFRPLLEKAGIPPIRFHDLRHTTATLLLSMGTHPKIVQELLGHSQIIVTLEIYSHILPPLQGEAMLQFNTLLTAPDPS